MSMLETKHEKKSFTITVVLHVILILLLIFFGLTYLDPPPESGIAINFGTSEVGSGNEQPKEPVKSAPKQATAQPVKSEPVIEKEVVTQDIEEAPVIEKKKKKPITFSSPIVASGRVIVVSSEGEVKAFSPQDGTQTGSLKLKDTVYIEPIAAQGRLYVLTDDAKLIAID